jgi:aspartate-semialdehyde dehydrogenase
MRQFGHTVHVKTELDGEPELNDVVDLLANYTSLPQTLDLPSAPINPIIIRDDDISPKEDCWAGATNPQNRDPAIDLKAGMAIVISNLSVERNVLSFSAFSENTIRGAAGGCLLLAELAFKQELLL